MFDMRVLLIGISRCDRRSCDETRGRKTRNRDGGPKTTPEKKTKKWARFIYLIPEPASRGSPSLCHAATSRRFRSPPRRSTWVRRSASCWGVGRCWSMLRWCRGCAVTKPHPHRPCVAGDREQQSEPGAGRIGRAAALPRPLPPRLRSS